MNINIRKSSNDGYVVEDYFGVFIFKTYDEMVKYLDSRLNIKIEVVEGNSNISILCGDTSGLAATSGTK